ncbi:hypothetical protein R3P38DRAFT_543142 [Favolaschia claudopus]|uniref:Uncharacterized protein n=1 Tax=Favolaschia claudopus TaxID=2862362 RepID=A0AAW0CI69_9AGAR
MSSPAIPHVVAFLTRPLLSAFPQPVVSTAQLILLASLSSVKYGTYILNATAAPPTPILAASVGANIPWAKWLEALGSDEIILFFGPGSVKVRRGTEDVKDVWSEENEGSIVPISRIQAQSRASLPKKHNRNLRSRNVPTSARRTDPTFMQPIRIPSLLLSPSSDSDSSESSEPESDCYDSDAVSLASSMTAVSSSSPSTPPKCPSALFPAQEAPSASLPRARTSPKNSASPRPLTANSARKDTMAYLYNGGVTRVMTGGVMLGPRFVVRSTFA